MKRILLVASSAIALNGATLGAAFASEPAPKAEATPVVAGSATTAVKADVRASVNASADAASVAAIKTEQTRKELAELRTQMQELTRKMAALSSELGEGGPRSYAYRYLADPDRAMIGVVLDGDDDGARLAAVTPDGPAARAGLREGDIITAIDKQSVDADGARASYQKAHTLLANLKPGQNVRIDYRRGNDKGSVTLAAVRREAINWPLVMSDDPEHPMLPKDFDERVRRNVERAFERDRDRIERQTERATREAMKRVPGPMHIPMPWWGLNLAALNADLGRYFGTDKGVLVLSADDHSLPGIRAGDVITSVAGETVNRPEDALRALRDQESGKEVPIKLLRDRKTLALNMKAPAFNSIFNLRVPAPLPAPAAAPAPPAPPVPDAPSAPDAPAVPAPPAIAGSD